MKYQINKEKTMNTTVEEKQEKNHSNKKRMRRKGLTTALLLMVLTATTWWVWSEFFSPNTVETENAYTAAEIADVTSLVSGPVAQVQVHDTQFVKAGDILVTLDNADAVLAVELAQARLARTERSVRQLFANNLVLKQKVSSQAANLNAAQADVTRANADLKRTRLDLNRQRNLAKTDATSQEKLTNAEAYFSIAQAMYNQAEARVNVAKANYNTAIEELKTHATLIDGVTVETHPDLLEAQTKLKQAQLDLSRTIVHAPIDGIVSQRNVDIGQKIQPGQRLMTITPIDKIYVNANFKEAQLSEIRPGQHVQLISDFYGSKVLYKGTVIGLSGGSGSAFAAIPAQNATGNWIKVVQRVPVRIELDKEMLQKHPLRVGLSMHVTVNLDPTYSATDLKEVTE